MPEALAINDRFLEGLAAGLGACYADDHILGHHGWSYLLAWESFQELRPPATPRPQGRIHFKHAGLLIEQRGESRLYLALNKGGVFKFFRGDKLIHSDTQFSVTLRAGKRRNAVAHLVGKYDTQLGAEEVVISGKLGWAKSKQMTSFNLIVLRGLMFTVGRFFPNLIRKLLQKMLITGKTAAPLRFERRLSWEQNQLVVRDELAAGSWRDVEEIGIGPAQTSIYVVMSRTFQRGQLQPWLDLTDKIPGLTEREPLLIERRF